MSIIPLGRAHTDAITDVYRHAFPDDEADTVAGLLCELVRDASEPGVLTLGSVVQGRLVAAAGFSPVYFEDDVAISAHILAPLAVHRDFQRRGVASGLIDFARQKLAGENVDVLLVYGDPGYYGRFGFSVEAGAHFIPPYPLEFPTGWQALVLSDVALDDTPYRFRCVPALSDASYW